MVRLSDGDRTAFDVLLDELWPVVRSFAERGVGQGPDAEDVAQEVFFKICSRIAEFDRSRDAVSWAFGIASYEILTHRRRLARRREVYDDPALHRVADPGASQEEALLEREVASAFEQAALALTEEDRLALGLGCGTEPLALAAATLRKRKQRARDRFRDLWRRIHARP